MARIRSRSIADAVGTWLLDGAYEKIGIVVEERDAGGSDPVRDGRSDPGRWADSSAGGCRAERGAPGLRRDELRTCARTSGFSGRWIRQHTLAARTTPGDCSRL